MRVTVALRRADVAPAETTFFDDDLCQGIAALPARVADLGLQAEMARKENGKDEESHECGV